MIDITVTPLCGICVSRDGTVEEVLDGRRTFLCASCSAERVPDHEAIERRESDRRRGRLITAIRWNPGATFAELRTVLDIPSFTEDKHVYDCYQTTLSRMVAAGVFRRQRDAEGWHYWLVGPRR